MTTFITIEYAPNYNTTICTARRFTAEEKKHYTPEFREKGFVGLGDDITLKHIGLFDLPDREADGSFLGCNNFAYIITEAERDEYIRLNAERAAEVKRKEREAAIKDLRYQIAKAERQRDLPTREEADRRMKRYNDVQNEGYEGYVPYIYSRDEYDTMKKHLAELIEESRAAEKGGKADGKN